MNSICLPAVLRSFCPDLRFDFRHELPERLFAFDDNTLALVDLIESLSGCLPKCFQVRLAYLFLFFQQTQRLADNFAGVAVAPRGYLAFYKWSKCCSVRLMLRVGIAALIFPDLITIGNKCQPVGSCRRTCAASG
jgi:hypothetical protein